MKKNESYSELMHFVLVHMKLIQMRLDFSEDIIKGAGPFGKALRDSANRVKVGIANMSAMLEKTTYPKAAKILNDYLSNEDERMYNIMIITEQLMDRSTAELGEIVSLIDDYTASKYPELNGEVSKTVQEDTENTL